MQRRKFLIGTGAAAVGAVNPTLAAPSIRAAQSLRRVVVTTDGEGSRVLADGEPTNAFELNGTKIMRLWETSAVPTSLPVDVDAGATAESAYREGFAGTSFYVAEIPPGVGRQQIPMHRNETLDYMAILQGEIHLVLPDREILLQQGDTLIQAGVMHSWENRASEPCRLLFVVVPGQRDDR